MSLESILAPHVDLTDKDVRDLNRGKRPSLDGSALEVTLFAVGQGEAILVRHQDRGLLIDGGAGSRTNNNTTGARKLFNTFPPNKRLDAIIASHPHWDHTNFYPCLVKDFPDLISPGAVYYDNGTEPATNHWNTVSTAKHGSVSITRKAVTSAATLVPPWKGYLFANQKGADVKYWSVFLLLRHHDAWFLFTGDAKKSYEEALLPKIKKRTMRIHVLKITHHGASSGTSPKLVRELRPSLAVSSSVQEDPKHRLEDDVRGRLLAARVYATDEDWEEEGRPRPSRRGNLVLRTDGNNSEIGRVKGFLFEVDRTK